MTVYDARLATTTTKAVKRRLDWTALLRGRNLNEVLTEALDQTLPHLDELARQAAEQAATS